MSNTKSIAFLGAGAMGGAILRGVLGSGLPVQLRAADASPEHLEELRALGVAVFDAREPDGPARAVSGVPLVILAVKPNLVRTVLEGLGDALAPGTVLVSIAAGVTTQTLGVLVPAGVRVVRVMPNLPAMVGRGVTALTAGPGATGDDLDAAEEVFATVGDVIRVEESQMDAVTSISGSGPAYVFYLIEALTAAAEYQGFSAEQAGILTAATFRGASELLASGDKTPAQLRRAVTSPHGTTEAALGVLMNSGVEQILRDATDAAVRRAAELAAEA